MTTTLNLPIYEDLTTGLNQLNGPRDHRVSYDHPEMHQTIYDYLSQKVDPEPLEVDAPRFPYVPPFDLLVYAVRNILYPTLHQYGDLITVLANIEWSRQLVSRHLKQQRKRKHSDESHLLFCYYEIVQQCELLDVASLHKRVSSSDAYTTALSRYEALLPDFMRFEEEEHEDNQQYMALRSQRIADTRRARELLVKQIYDFAEERAEAGLSIDWGDVDYLNAFAATFPNPLQIAGNDDGKPRSETTLIGEIEYYLRNVTKIIQKVQDKVES